MHREKLRERGIQQQSFLQTAQPEQRISESACSKRASHFCYIFFSFFHNNRRYGATKITFRRCRHKWSFTRTTHKFSPAQWQVIFFTHKNPNVGDISLCFQQHFIFSDPPPYFVKPHAILNNKKNAYPLASENFLHYRNSSKSSSPHVFTLSGQTHRTRSPALEKLRTMKTGLVRKQNAVTTMIATVLQSSTFVLLAVLLSHIIIFSFSFVECCSFAAALQRKGCF